MPDNSPPDPGPDETGVFHDSDRAESATNGSQTPSHASDATAQYSLSDIQSAGTNVDPSRKSNVSRGMTSETALAGEFGDYDLQAEIARGGMGVVYRAHHRRLNRTVALKMILAGEFASSVDVDRFQAEAQAAARLDHPGIVPIYEVGERDGRHFFAMKYLEGGSLAQRLNEFRSDTRRAVELVVRVCQAVHHAHQRGILHRDLKPANILLDADGAPVITDLGLARRVDGDSQLTRTGTVVGTPSYMPPEQATGSSDITTAVDVYAIGAILYEILCGVPPFQGANPIDTMMRVVSQQPASPSSITPGVDRDLELVCLKCLAKSPADRYISVVALADDLNRWLRGEPISVKPASVFTTLRLWMRQNFGSATSILIVGLASGLILGVLLWIATFQSSGGEWDELYDTLPRATRPALLVPWSTPRVMQALAMGASVLILAFVGYLVGVTVRPKNRDADVVAGILAGIFAATSFYATCAGPFGHASSNLRNDVPMLAALGSENTNTATMNAIFDQYPDLEGMSREKRIQVIEQKLRVDNIVTAPLVICKGMAISLFWCVSATVFETMVAGRLLRKPIGLATVLVRYLEIAGPFCACLVLCAVLISSVVLLGGWGIITHVRAILLVLSGGLAIWLAYRNERLVWRFAAFAAWSCALLAFGYIDFTMIPPTSEMRAGIARSERLVAQEPENARFRQRLIERRVEFATYLRDFGYPRHALRQLQNAREELRADSSMRDTMVTNLHVQLATDMASAYIDQGRIDEGLDLFRETIGNHPSRWWLYDRFLSAMIDADRIDDARAYIVDRQITTPATWSFAARLADAFVAKLERRQIIASDAMPDEFEHLMNDLLTNQTTMPATRRDALQRWLGSRITWRVLAPLPAGDQHREFRQSTPAFDDVLRRTADSGGKSDRSWRDITARPGAYIDLRQHFGIHEHVIAYAVFQWNEPARRTIRLLGGSDDGMRLWVNEQLIFDVQKSRDFFVGQDQSVVTLEAGQNEIVVVVDQLRGNWGFAVDPVDEDGWPIELP